MKRLIILALALSLGGCATVTKLEQVYSAAVGKTVPPAYALATANTFDALEATATAYLRYCKGNLAVPACSAANRRAVIKYTRDGRAVRNQVEGYITTNTPVPSAIYDLLVAAVNSLTTSSASNYGAK
jgi:hypothetical protein